MPPWTICPRKLRTPLLEHFLEGRTQQDIAGRLGVSQATISRLLDTGIERLRAHLRRRGVAAGGALAVILATHAVTPAPAALVTSLGKLAVSGVGGSAADTPAAGPRTGRGLAGRWRYIAASAIGLIVITSWLFRQAGATNVDSGAAVVTPDPSAPVQDWNGRAFCPMCAAPMTAGREPTHGIFVHVEGEREVIYDLALTEPIPDFHARLCVPSMDDVHAVHVRGRVHTRDGRLALAASVVEPRMR